MFSCFRKSIITNVIVPVKIYPDNYIIDENSPLPIPQRKLISSLKVKEKLNVTPNLLIK
jgi:hypothetical protein